MNELDEMRVKAIRVIKNIITLKTNVANRCPNSREELDIQEPRLIAIKEWAIANNQLTTIKLFLIQGSFGMREKFYANEISTFFHA